MRMIFLKCIEISASECLRAYGRSSRTFVLLAPARRRVFTQPRPKAVFERPHCLTETAAVCFLQIAGRQSDLKDRPVRLVGRYPKAPTMGLDDRPTDGKSYSGSSGLCCKERLEDKVLVLTLYSRTRVLNGDRNPGRLLNDIGANPQHPRTIGDGAHRFNRVHNQIQKYLLQLASIGKQLWEAIAQLSCDRYSVVP